MSIHVVRRVPTKYGFFEGVALLSCLLLLLPYLRTITYRSPRVHQSRGGDTLVHESDGRWEERVCTDIEDAACHHVLVLAKRQVTFCSAAKVASTTIRQYFYDISDDLVIPKGSRFGVHEANWTRLANLEPQLRSHLLQSPDWTHVFFMRHVVERFISGYLDKVVNDCEIYDLDTDYPSVGPLVHYRQYGFSCQQHSGLEAFVAFLESVPSLEGHFAPQTPLCNLQKYPYTDIIHVDDKLSTKLETLSIKLGVQHPTEKNETRSHETGAKQRMASLFRNREELIPRILKLFKEDCDLFPKSCAMS